MKLKLMSTFLFVGNIILTPSCDSVFDVHPYDVRVKGETNINAMQIRKIESMVKAKDTIRFAFISDTHQWLSDLSDEVADINKKDPIDFVIHGGDATDFCSTREFEWTREKLLKLKKPFVVLLGNHDCLGTSELAYGEKFGSPDFCFVAGRVKGGFYRSGLGLWQASSMGDGTFVRCYS